MRVHPGSCARPLLVAAVLAALALGPAAGSASAYKVTFIGDSKSAMIEFSPRAQRLLADGYTMRRDLKVCRRLVALSCTYNGSRPRTALQAVNYYGNGLGRVLVIDVGYNDSSTTYRGQLDQVMNAALDHGVRGVVWVNLRAVRPDYKKINRIIRKAPNRWPKLHVANWNKYARGHPSWFSPQINDGIHLTNKGAVKLVKLVRRYIPRANQGAAASQPMLAGLPGGTALGAGSSSSPGASSATETPSAAVAVATTSSPPVGLDLGGSADGSTGPSSLLAFAGGALLMLFLVLVTLRRRRAA